MKNLAVASLPGLTCFSLAVLLCGCGAGGGSSTTTPPPITISVSPASANVALGGPQQFAANVANTSIVLGLRPRGQKLPADQNAT